MTTEHNPTAEKRERILTGFGLGLFVLYLSQLAMGLLLEANYRATAADAYEKVSAMQGGLAIFRGYHYWGSALLILGGIAYLVLLLRQGIAGRSKRWVATVMLFLAVLFAQITGNLLPFDRHGVQTAVVEVGVARQIPVIGEITSRAMVGGDQFGVQTVQIWHWAHLGSMVIGIAAAATFWIDSRKRPYTQPLLWIPAATCGLIALMSKAPLGQPATGIDFTSYDAKVSWYTWPLHASLNLFSKLSPSLGWVGSAVVPGLFAALLVFAPWIARRMSEKVVGRILLGFGAYFLIAMLLVGGGFAPLTGNRDPVAAEEGQLAPIGQADTVLFAKGRELFNSVSCSGCHGLDGKKPVSGPNLSDIGRRRGGNPDWYMRFIKNPAATKGGSTMPPFPKLTDEQRRAIAEFLIHNR